MEKKNFDWKVAVQRIRLVRQFVEELSIGLQNDMIPHHWMASIAMVSAGGFYFAAEHAKHLWVERLFLIGIAVSGYIGWALFRLQARQKFLGSLTEIFDNAGIKTSNGSFPSFISDEELDSSSRVMTLNSNRIPISTFQAAKEKLEAGMFGFIDRFDSDQISGVIRIYYSEHDFPKIVDLESVTGYGNYSFAIGKTRLGKLVVNLIEVPHFLIAGSSNSGKSTLVKQVIATIYLNNPGVEIVLIDLKFGLESIQFKNLPRVDIFQSAQSALQVLIALQTELKERGERLYKADCKDIIAYNKMILTKPQSSETAPLRRKVIFIDEAAQLFLAGPDLTAGEAVQARGIISSIAAQGRAVGLNLFVCTQRPDVNIIDGSIKANLHGRVCFHMADHAASMTILDSTRAAHLPNVPGRAIFRSGAEILEIQVPQITDENLAELFRNVRREPKPAPPQPPKPSFDGELG